MPQTDNASPRITRLEWGRVEIAGGRRFRDAKLFPGGAREWDWGETGTHHQPGIQPVDVEELLDLGAEVIVLSRGHHERLQTCPETLALLEQRGVEVHQLQTKQAVDLYNELAGKERVGALIHSTC